MPEGVLHLWPNGALFVGADMFNEAHRHFTASVILGLEGPVRVRVEPSREFMAMDGVMVAPNVEQQLDARGIKLAILQIDPESDVYAGIAHHFVEAGVRSLSSETIERVRDVFLRLDGTSRAAFDAWSLTVGELTVNGAPRRPRDPRILRAMSIIKRDVLSPPPAAKLASAVGLSPGRLIHLFTTEMGLPMRRYVLWLRLRDVLISLAAGSTLTEAAHHAGFSDSAHLSRTFRRMFGFPPSILSEGRGRVRLGYDLGISREQPSPHAPLDDDERFARSIARR